MADVNKYNGANDNYDEGKENVNTSRSIYIDGKCTEDQDQCIHNGDCMKEEKCTICKGDVAMTLNLLDNENSVHDDCGGNETEISPNEQAVEGEHENVTLPINSDNTDSQKHIETTSVEIHMDEKINRGDNIELDKYDDKEKNSGNIENVSNVFSDNGSNKDNEVYNRDKENIPYTLQLYLENKDGPNEEYNTQYDDFVIISTNDISITGTVIGNSITGTVIGNDFTEIELSDVDRKKSILDDGVVVDGDNKNVTLSSSPQGEGDTETNSILLSQQARTENEPSKDISEKETSQAISEKRSQTISVNGSIDNISTNDVLSEEKIIHIFPKNAGISITLKYTVNLKCIMGNIRSTLGLGYIENTTCPEFIQFHVIVLPEDKYRLTTKWVHASVKSLAWKFTIGPLPEDINSKGMNIRFRLYGRSKAMVPRCYGECFVPLENVMEAEKSVEFEETILPKGTLKNMNVKCRRKSKGHNAPPRRVRPTVP